MVFARVAIAQDCRSIRVMSYTGLTQMLWEVKTCRTTITDVPDSCSCKTTEESSTLMQMTWKMQELSRLMPALSHGCYVGGACNRNIFISLNLVDVWPTKIFWHWRFPNVWYVLVTLFSSPFWTPLGWQSRPHVQAPHSFLRWQAWECGYCSCTSLVQLAYRHSFAVRHRFKSCPKLLFNEHWSCLPEALPFSDSMEWKIRHIFSSCGDMGACA